MPKPSWKLFFMAVLVILGFTLADYFGHVYLEKNAGLESVPSNYFSNKMLYGVPLLILGVFLIDWTSRRYGYFTRPYVKASAIALFTVMALQARYLYLGYPLRFHLIVLSMHYVILSTLVYFNRGVLS